MVSYLNLPSECMRSARWCQPGKPGCAGTIRYKNGLPEAREDLPCAKRHEKLARQRLRIGAALRDCDSLLDAERGGLARHVGDDDFSVVRQHRHPLVMRSWVGPVNGKELAGNGEHCLRVQARV